MTRRTGVPTMLEEAQKLSGHISDFQPTIQGLYPTNSNLQTALVDCASCLINLITELSKVREKGD